MKKSYPDLRKELDESVIEVSRLNKHIDSLALSVKKRGLPLTYKKALMYVGKVVWSPKTDSWLLIESVQQRSNNVAVVTISVQADSVQRVIHHLFGPNDDFLSEEPAEFPEHFQACFYAVMKDCAKYFRLYGDQRNAKSAADALATKSTGSDKASQK